MHGGYKKPPLQPSSIKKIVSIQQYTRSRNRLTRVKICHQFKVKPKLGELP